MSPRPSSTPAFWNTRYDREDHLFGTAPSAFVRAHASRLPDGGSVVELGAGEGRSLVWLAQAKGMTPTAVDFSETALNGARALADAHGVDLETVAADVRTWQPNRRWDAAVVTFVQLLPDERPALYNGLRRIVRPGGIILGEWFRPDHLSGAYARIGPSTPDRMVPVDELAAHFADATLHRCAPVDVTLDEGDFLHGPAALSRLVAEIG